MLISGHNLFKASFKLNAILLGWGPQDNECKVDTC